MDNKNIPKEDRAYLYFRENKQGKLNIKFGPEKYDQDTKKFTEILFTGMLYGAHMLSAFTKDLGVEVRKEQYENLALTFNSILNDTFPDIFELKKQELLYEEMAIEAVESGDKVSEETKEKIDELKASVQKRIVEKNLEQEIIKKENFEKELFKLEEELNKIEEELELLKDRDKEDYIMWLLTQRKNDTIKYKELVLKELDSYKTKEEH